MPRALSTIVASLFMLSIVSPAIPQQIKCDGTIKKLRPLLIKAEEEKTKSKYPHVEVFYPLTPQENNQPHIECLANGLPGYEVIQPWRNPEVYDIYLRSGVPKAILDNAIVIRKR